MNIPRFWRRHGREDTYPFEERQNAFGGYVRMTIRFTVCGVRPTGGATCANALSLHFK